MSKCPPIDTEDESLLYVKVIDASSGEDITRLGEVEIVDLFIFESNGNFFEKISVSSDSIIQGLPIRLKNGNKKDLIVSAWGNLLENQSCSEITPDCILDSLSIELFPDDDGYGISPDDLFFGFKQLDSPKSVTSTQVIYKEIIPIKVKNAKLHITVVGLPDGIDESNYHFTIENTYNGYNFKGDPIEIEMHMKRTGVFNDLYHLHTPDPFNIVHVNSGTDAITINLHAESNTANKATSVLASVNKDKDGKPIAPLSGETTNILIDLRETGSVTVLMEITPWNEIYHWLYW